MRDITFKDYKVVRRCLREEQNHQSGIFLFAIGISLVEQAVKIPSHDSGKKNQHLPTHAYDAAILADQG
jgi:hypothetical protein